MRVYSINGISKSVLINNTRGSIKGVKEKSSALFLPVPQALFFFFMNKTKQLFGNTQLVLRARAVKLAEPVVYYSKVAFSLLKQIAIHAKLNQININNAVQGLTKFTEAFTNGQWKNVTIKETLQLLTEAVKIGGFFLVGEMIGRRSIVGYDIKGSQAHHH
jgi:hypothetical protein